MTYTVSSGSLNSSIPYHTDLLFSRSLELRSGPPKSLWRRPFGCCWCKVSTGQMHFLSPNQQCRSRNERVGNCHSNNKYLLTYLLTFLLTNLAVVVLVIVVVLVLSTCTVVWLSDNSRESITHARNGVPADDLCLGKSGWPTRPRIDDTGALAVQLFL